MGKTYKDFKKEEFVQEVMRRQEARKAKKDLRILEVKDENEEPNISRYIAIERETKN